jgi:uncharacterized membrane protein
MIAGHFPVAFGQDHAWLVLLAIFALVVAIRHFFNLWHRGRRVWWLLGAAGAGAVALTIALAPDDVDAGAAPSDAAAARIVAARCASCHSGAAAPLGVRFENVEQMRQNADGIEAMVGSGAMPPGNATGLTDDERQQLVAWAAAAG